MKKKFILLNFLLLIFDINCQLEISVKYLGENLYIQNPEDGDGFGFCVDSVFVNNKKQSDSLINTAAIELSLVKLNLALGSEFNIKIYHKSGCLPRIINPSNFHTNKIEFLEIQLDENGNLTWKTKNEMKGYRFDLSIEKLNTDKKWVSIATIEQKWEEINNYSYKVDLKSGENTYRIAMIKTHHHYDTSCSEAVNFTKK